jgi:integrase
VFTTTGDRPVSGFAKAKARLDAELLKTRHKRIGAQAEPMPDWTLHDLRRTLATGLADLGVLPHVTEKILTHNPKALSGVAGIYNRHEYLAERKAAIEAWDQRLNSIALRTME